jgi:hypothetical protein
MRGAAAGDLSGRCMMSYMYACVPRGTGGARVVAGAKNENISTPALDSMNENAESMLELFMTQ